MATLSAADAVTPQFDLLPNRTAYLVLAPSSFVGRAFLQRRVGSQWETGREVGTRADTIQLRNEETSPVSYRVWVQARASGSLDATFSDTGAHTLRRTVMISAAGYAALATADPDTLYVIVG
jgi:hypothetical protein